MYGLEIANYAYKIQRCCFLLLIPYVLWQILVAIHDIASYHSRYSIKDVIYQNFAFVQWPFDGALWYVYAVFLLAKFSPILLILFTNKNIGFIMLICLISFIEYYGNITEPLFHAVINYGYIPNVLSYLPSFLIGAFKVNFLMN